MTKNKKFALFKFYFTVSSTKILIILTNLIKKFKIDMKKMKHMDTQIVDRGSIIDQNSKILQVFPSPPNFQLTQENSEEWIIPEKGFCIHFKGTQYRDNQSQEVDIFLNLMWSERVDDVKTQIACSHCDSAKYHHYHEENSISAPKEKTGVFQPGENHYLIPYILIRSYKSRTMRIYDYVVGRKTWRRARQDLEFLAYVLQAACESIVESYEESILPNFCQLLQETDYKHPPESQFPETNQLESSERIPIEEPSLHPYINRKLRILEKM